MIHFTTIMHACPLLLLVVALENSPTSPAASNRPQGVLSDQKAIQRAHETLSSRWRYPWYDSASDELKRMKPPPDWDLWPDWKFNWGGSGSWLRAVLWTVVILVAALAAYALLRIYLLRSSMPDDSAGPTIAGARSHSERMEELPLTLDERSDLLGLARRMYEIADFNRAIIYLYSYQLLELDRFHLIRLSKGKTNRQYLRELIAHAPLRSLLEQTMCAFEDSFFGNHTLRRDRFESCWRRLSDFKRLAEQAP